MSLLCQCLTNPSDTHSINSSGRSNIIGAGSYGVNGLKQDGDCVIVNVRVREGRVGGRRIFSAFIDDATEVVARVNKAEKLIHRDRSLVQSIFPANIIDDVLHKVSICSFSLSLSFSNTEP